MTKLYRLFTLFAGLYSFGLWSQGSDEEVIRDLYSYALTKHQGYEWLKDLTNIGGRLAGSPEADSAVAYFREVADSMGFETSLMPGKSASLGSG